MNGNVSGGLAGGEAKLTDNLKTWITQVFYRLCHCPRHKGVEKLIFQLCKQPRRLCQEIRVNEGYEWTSE